MKKISENFLTKMKKLTNYLVTHEDNKGDYVILATGLTITQHINKQSVFTYFEDNIDKTFTVTFIVAFKENNPDIQKFKKFPIPVLTLNKDNARLSTEDLKFCLDGFVDKIKS